MAIKKRGFQDVEYVLRVFGKKVTAGRKACRAFVNKRITQGRRPDFVGGGLIRSAGGWSVDKALPKSSARIKGDERILGDGDFVENVLKEAQENLERKYKFEAQG